jgi:hypothetical protein
MTEPRKLRVFLCHASQDKPIVRELYQRLLAEGWIDPWLDEEKLLPGMDWGMEIEKAVEAADVVIVCLSNSSITKEGYVQREMRFVLEIALTKPENSIFIIPLHLEKCVPPYRLKVYQYIDYYPKKDRDRKFERILGSLRIRAQEIKISPKTYSNSTQELFEHEYGRWRLRNTVIPIDSLEHFYTNKDKFVVKTEDEWLCILVSALKEQRNLYEWIRMAKRKNIDAVVRLLIAASNQETQILMSIFRRLKSKRLINPLLSIVPKLAVGQLPIMVDFFVDIGEPLIPVMFNMLGSSEFQSRAVASSVLGKKGIASAIEPLIAICSTEKDKYVLQCIIRSLGELNAKEAVSLIAKYLRDEDRSVRNSAIVALGAIGDASAVEVMKPYVDDPQSGLLVVEAFGKIESQEATNILLTILEKFITEWNDNDYYTKEGQIRIESLRLVVRGLGKSSASNAVSSLDEILGILDYEGDIVRDILATLEKIGTERAKEIVRNWEWSREMELEELRARGIMGPDMADR